MRTALSAIGSIPGRRVRFADSGSRPSPGLLPPPLSPSRHESEARRLPQFLSLRADPPPQLTFHELHQAKGTPPAARAALAAFHAGASWVDVGRAFQLAAARRRLAQSASLWRCYLATGAADDFAPLPLTLDKVVAWWAARVLGRHLKSSALQSATSRLLSHAALLGQPVSQALAAEIWDVLPRFCASFPCEVSSAAPPLGDAGDDRLSTAIAFAATRADHSLLFRGLHTLLLLAQALYCRPSAVLNGNLKRGNIASVPASPIAPGGLVLRLLLPKMNQGRVDMRMDSFPIPTGAASTAILSWLRTVEQIRPGTSAEDAVFPDIDPSSDSLRGPHLTVTRATELLRRHIFIPAGIAGGARLTLRSIRSGASTDAAASGTADPDRIAQGGWASARGARVYLDRVVSTLAGTNLASTPQTPPSSRIKAAQASLVSDGTRYGHL